MPTPAASRRSSKRSATSLPSPTTPVGDSSSRAARWTAVAGLVVSIGLLYWPLRDVRLGDVVGHARRARVGWLVAGVALATLTFPIRTLRWRLILRDVDGHRLPLVPLWRALAVGVMANNLLPARAGGVGRGDQGNRPPPVRFTPPPPPVVLGAVSLRRSSTACIPHGLPA